MSLYIDIKKKLPGFKLQVKLSCEHEIIGVLGASGSGKSMLLNCIAGLVKPDEGKIVINDKMLFDSEKKINLPPKDRKTGFLFQNYALFPHLTISENIAYGLGALSKQDRNTRVTELIERFHLTNMEKRYPSQLSGGQQQRVALARAIAAEPTILLLDEPFSALDAYLRTHMLKEMLAALKNFQGSTLFVTHNMDEAYILCNRLALLNAGNIEAFGEKSELFQNPKSLEAAKITGYKNISTAIRKSEHIIEIPDWGIHIESSTPIENDKGYIAIRANNIKLANKDTNKNCFEVWIADECQASLYSTLYLKIGAKPCKAEDFHIQWEISREQAATIRNIPQPFIIYIDPKDISFIEK